MATSLNTSRPVRDIGPMSNPLPAITNLTAARVLTDDDHGKTFTLDLATGFQVTLPAANGTGYTVKFIVKTTNSGGSYTIVCAGSDKMNGYLHAFGDDASAVGGFATSAGTATTFTMDGSTRAGFAGDYVEVTDYATGLWSVRAYGHATGTEATPFS